MQCHILSGDSCLITPTIQASMFCQQHGKVEQYANHIQEIRFISGKLVPLTEGVFHWIFRLTYELFPLIVLQICLQMTFSSREKWLTCFCSRKFNEIEAFRRRRGRRAVLRNVSSKKFQGIKHLHQMAVARSSVQFLLKRKFLNGSWFLWRSIKMFQSSNFVLNFSLERGGSRLLKSIS